MTGKLPLRSAVSSHRRTQSPASSHLTGHLFNRCPLPVPATLSPRGGGGVTPAIAAPDHGAVAAHEAPNRRVIELDGLRGLAIALVLLLHYVMRAPPAGQALRDATPRLWALLDLSWCGVDLFFVISGFLIGGILLDHRGSPALRKTFYLRRACRILPAYAMLLVFAFSTLFANPAPASSGTVPLYAYALFIHNFWTLAGAHVVAFLVPTWSIAIEEQFYLVAPFVVPLLSLRTLRRVLVACIVLAPLLRLLSVLGLVGVSFWDFTLCRLDAPAAGVLGALLVRDPDARLSMSRLLPIVRRALPLLLGGVVLASQLMLVTHPLRGDLVLFTAGISWLLLSALAMVLVVTHYPSSLMARIARSRWLVYLGRRSYFVYLFHMPALWALRGLPLRQLPRIVVALTMILALAELSWRCIEHPILRLGHRLRYDGGSAG